MQKSGNVCTWSFVMRQKNFSVVFSTTLCTSSLLLGSGGDDVKLSPAPALGLKSSCSFGQQLVAFVLKSTSDQATTQLLCSCLCQLPKLLTPLPSYKKYFQKYLNKAQILTEQVGFLSNITETSITQQQAQCDGREPI